MIASRKFEAAATQPPTSGSDWRRRLAHKIADEIVLQFTGEKGVADTKISYVVGPSGAKELVVADYDGFGTSPMTRNGSINLSPVWSPDARSIAFTSFMSDFGFLQDRKVPTLAVVGTRDQYCPPESFASFVAERPWIKTATIEGADHFFFGKLFPLGEAVAEWARQLSSGRGAR